MNNNKGNEPMNEQVSVEVMPPEMADVIRREGVNEGAGQGLITAFAPFHQQITVALDASKGVSDGANPTHQRIARACRLELRRVRCKVEDARKAAKADALRYGKAVDGLANVLKFLCEPEENRLEEIEKHAERLETARVAQLVADRTTAMVAVGADPAIYNLATMDDATFEAAIDTAKRIIAEREETMRKAEADRVAREKADAEDRARVREENERLKAKADAREKEVEAERARIEADRKAERDKAEAALKAERQAREKAQAEAGRIFKAQADTKKAQAEAQRKAAAAPDRDKLTAFAATVAALTVPAMATEAGQTIASEVQAHCAAFAEWIKSKAGEL